MVATAAESGVVTLEISILKGSPQRGPQWAGVSTHLQLTEAWSEWCNSIQCLLTFGTHGKTHRHLIHVYIIASLGRLRQVSVAVTVAPLHTGLGETFPPRCERFRTQTPALTLCTAAKENKTS